MTENANKAKLTPITNAAGAEAVGESITVDFNPESLALTIRNQMEQSKPERPPQQLVSSSEVTLAVQLIFDSTMTGLDVRVNTAKIAEMMRPGTVVPREDGKRRPQVVKFEWNTFAFEGIITDYSETLDYFSSNGVPLRSNLNISITKHEDAFPAPGGGSSDVGAGSTPPTTPVASGESADDLANKTGNTGKGPEIGAANGSEDIRNMAEQELASPKAAAEAGKAAGAFGSALGAGAGAGAGAGVGFEFGSPPAAFASGDAGFGLDLGLSAGVSVGAGASLAAGSSLGGGAAAGAGAEFGAGAAAGAGASFGASAGGGGGLELDAFAGLNPPTSVSVGASLGGEVSFDLPDPPSLSAGVSLGVGAGVSLGGAAGVSLGAGAGIGGGEIVKVGKEINLADILFKGEE